MTGVFDTYDCEHTAFDVFGEEVSVCDDKLVEALKNLPEKKLDIIMMFYFMDMSDKYMNTFGLEVSNDVFAQHSWYFRNALVRANYSNLKNGVHATTGYLELFFNNLLMGTNYELKNRYLHIEYTADFEPPKTKREIISL